MAIAKFGIGDLRLQCDFWLRRWLGFPWPIRNLGHDEPKFEAVAQEVFDFLNRSGSFPPTTTRLKVVDVGTKDFAFAPALYRYFGGPNGEVEIHGVEIDSYRRLSNLHTRWDYAQYFQKAIPNAHYHAMDWLNWNEPVDVVLMLNPFVTPEPLRRWGLPRKLYRPNELFHKAAEMLRAPHGTLITSAPTPNEQAHLEKLARQAGFRLLKSWDWQPAPRSVQRQPRYGARWSLETTCKILTNS